MDMTSRIGPHIIKPRPIAPYKDRFAISGGAIRSFFEFLSMKSFEGGGVAIRDIYKCVVHDNNQPSTESCIVGKHLIFWVG